MSIVNRKQMVHDVDHYEDHIVKILDEILVLADDGDISVSKRHKKLWFLTLKAAYGEGYVDV